MKFLLTSGGITNDSIRNALIDLLGKPIAASTVFVKRKGNHLTVEKGTTSASQFAL